MTLRTRPDNEYDKTRKELGHHGPYLPILLEACQEQELSYEYRDGATSYGAYTFSMAKVLREHRGRGANLSFSELNELVMQKLRRLKYKQTPNLVGPRNVLKQQLPWVKPAKKGPAKTSGASTAGVRATQESAGPGTARRRAKAKAAGGRSAKRGNRKKRAVKRPK